MLDRIVVMASAPTHIQAKEPVWMHPLLRSYRALSTGAESSALLPAFADEVIACPAVKDDVEPLVSLLTSFATQRINGAR